MITTRSAEMASAAWAGDRGESGTPERPVKERRALQRSLLTQPGHPGTETWGVPLCVDSLVFPGRGGCPQEVALCAGQVIMKLGHEHTWSTGAAGTHDES